MSATLLAAYAAALDARDWPAHRALLAPGFGARFLHSGETFDADAYVAFQADYPGTWRVTADDVVVDGARGVVRLRVSDGTETFHAAVFATVEHGLLRDLVEVWTEAEAPVTR